MTLSINNMIIYLSLTYLFYDVLAISPCDIRQIPFKLEKLEGNRPLLQETVSTTVNLSLSINDLSILDIKNLDVEIDLGITQQWYDHRLAPDYQTRKLAVIGGIWQPKITFIIGNKCRNIFSAENYDETQFWRGTSNGSVLYSERFLVKPKCTKDLTKYPFDSQTCFLKIGSYRFTAEEVSLQWIDEEPIELRVKKELGEFRLEKLETYNEIDVRSAGNFSVLVLEIHLIRYSRREVIQTFIPSVIFVKIAYGVFWMNLADIRTRIYTCQFSLAGTLFLFTKSNTNILSNFINLKALDIWFLISILFVVLPLVESVVVNYFHSTESLQEENFEIENDFDGAGCIAMKSSQNIAIWIDKISRLLHPIGLLASTILFIAVFNNKEINDR